MTSHLNRGYVTLHFPPDSSIVIYTMAYLVRMIVIVHEPTRLLRECMKCKIAMFF